MANRGVFNRNETGLTVVQRSKQNLSHRHTFTTRFGQITPKFDALLLPHESITIRNTDFLRTIPMKTPQLSRIRIVTRFVAVPLRILWQPFEDYIDPTKDEQYIQTEPHVVNFNAIRGTLAQWHNLEGADFPVQTGTAHTYTDRSSVISEIRKYNSSVNDFSTIGITGIAVNTQPVGSSPNTWSRCAIVQRSDGYPNVSANVATQLAGYQFFPHELGDYFNAPTYVTSLWQDESGRLSAWKYGAYQLAYSYLYRKPNVQTRVDDYYEMSHHYDDQIFTEFPSLYATWRSDTGVVPPISNALKAVADGSAANFASGVVQQINPSAITFASGENYDHSKTNGMQDVFATSWSKVEKFPLKSGPNISLSGTDIKSDGMTVQLPTLISLTRMRYANWQDDRFTTANPWQQRGDEAQIPVVGSLSVDLDGVKFNLSSLSITGQKLPEYVHPRGTNESELNTDTGVLLSYAGADTNHPAWRSAITGKLSGGTVTDAYDHWLEINPETLAQKLSVTGESSTSSGGTLNVSSPQYGAMPSGNTGIKGFYVSPSSFRFAMQLQKIKEMSARTDGRYKSFLSMFYGSKSRDSRLDRPEFIGGFVQDLNISEIAQTSPTDNQPLGTLAGRGVSARRSSVIHYSASEHTVILGLQHIIPDSEYVGGLNRTDHYIDSFDYPLPQFSGLSEQPIRMSELVLRSSKFDEVYNSDNDVAFGYEPRYNEKRAKHSYCTGAFRDYFNTTGSRDYYQPWLITRNFGFDVSLNVVNGSLIAGLDYNVPSLSDEFLSMRHTVDNSNFEVTNEEVMYPFMCDSYFDIQWVTVVPRRGIPRI